YARRAKSRMSCRAGKHSGAIQTRRRGGLIAARRFPGTICPNSLHSGLFAGDLTLPKQHQGLQVIQHLGQAYRSMQTAFSARVGHALPRWRILFTLHEHGQCSQKMLAEKCRLDPASLTRLLQAMQQQGWVARSADPHDNRVTNASLTPLGQAVVSDALPRRETFFE